jgi:hypothetical protein
MSENYTGCSTILVADSKINELYKRGHIDFPDNRFIWYPASYVELISNENEKHTALTKVKNNRLELIKPYKIGKIKSRNKEQVFAIDALLDPDIDLVVLTGHFGSGKAQPLDSLVLTPTGFKEMGTLKLGDEVIAYDGKYAKILGIFPQGKKEVYKISFSDGSFAKCCKEHLWKTYTYNERTKKEEGKVRNLETIANSLFSNKNFAKNHSIPNVKNINFKNDINLPIDPYTLGLLLGDGSLTQKAIQISSADQEIFDHIENNNPEIKLIYIENTYDARIIRSNKNRTMHCPIKCIRKNGVIDIYYSKEEIQKNGFNYSSVCRVLRKERKQHKNCKFEKVEKEKVKSLNPLVDKLMKLNLIGHNAYNKFIPDIYKYTSIDNRIALLQGLIDTDGEISKKNGKTKDNIQKKGCTIYYSTSSVQLAKDIQFIVESLGGTAKIKEKIKFYTYKNEKKQGKPNFCLTISLPSDIQPCRLQRKLEKYEPKTKYKPTRYVSNIEKTGEEECQCILIDHPEHLYITNNFIVTHNTLLSVASGLQAIEDKKYKRLILSKPMTQIGKHPLGILPGSVDEKLEPFLINYESNFRQLVSDDISMKDIIEQYHIEFRPIQLFLGASFTDTFLIIDEAANLEVKDIGALLSRAGENCKVVIMGDHKQIHDKIEKKNEGLRKLVNDKKIKESSFCAVVNLEKCERSRLATLIGDIFDE